VKWIKRAKRRKAGIYLARTRKHLAWARKENGYVGRSNNVPIRIKQHLGQDKRHPAKSWADLDPIWRVLWLPWWLSWKWVQVPLEWLAIKLSLPRYNYQHNLTNPRRVPLPVQARQRAERDAQPRIYHVKVAAARVGRITYLALGWAAVAGGLVMTVWSNYR
jgi:hypothetical protein